MAPFLGGTEDDPVSGISPLALLLSGYGKQGQQDPTANPNNPNAAPVSSNTIAPAASTPVAPAPQAAVGTVPTQPAAATTDALSKPLPQAPQIDPRHAALEALFQKDSQPTNPNDPSVKPHWWQRLLGGLATAGAAYQNNPNAMAIGNSVTNSRFNRAEQQREARLAGEQQQLGEMEGDYGRARQGFEDEMKTDVEQRQRAAESSLAGERSAKASKYENAIDPNSIRYDEEQDKFFGHSYGDPEGKEIETAPPRGWKSSAGPKTYEQLVIAEAQEKDPVRKAQYGAALKRIEGTEDKRFRYKEGASDNKPMTPGERLRQSALINKAGTDRKKALDELENGNPAKSIVGYKDSLKRIQNQPKLTADQKQKQIDDLNESHRQNKQDAEDSYASQLQTLGVDYKPVQYQKDGSAINPNQAAATRGGNQAALLARAKNNRVPPRPQPATPATPSQSGSAPRLAAGDTLTFDGKKQQVIEVRRNSKTGEHAYNIGGTWYRDSQLTPAAATQ